MNTMGISEWLRWEADRKSRNQYVKKQLIETVAANEIDRLSEALMQIAWGGFQSVSEAEQYARKVLGEDK